MNLLLDTHIALWAIADSPRLPRRARDMIVAADSHVWVSVASLWEIAIKRAVRPSHMPVGADEALDYFRQSGYRILAVEAQHVLALAGLPPLHADPFDRLLLAQAVSEPLRLITADEHIARYGEMAMRV